MKIFGERKKYIIIENNCLKRVSQGIYENWLENNSDQFDLPAYTVEAKNKKYTIDTDYVGSLEKNDPELPFVLFHFEDKIVNNKKGMKKTVKDVIEHFETFEELKKRREELIKRISKN